MNPLLKSIFSTEFGYAIFRVTTPILLPALGVAISGLSGAVNIALEGIMLASACAGVAVFSMPLISLTRMPLKCCGESILPVPDLPNWAKPGRCRW